MNKLTIPALLLAVVMIAGTFAFMPIQEASTVHATLQETSTNYVTVTSSGSVVGDDDSFLITCPSGNDACKILEIYVDNDPTGDLDPGVAQLDIDAVGSGETSFVVAADTGAVISTGAIATLTGVSNLALGPGMSLKILFQDTSNEDDYRIIVVAETEANQTITVVRIAT